MKTRFEYFNLLKFIGSFCIALIYHYAFPFVLQFDPESTPIWWSDDITSVISSKGALFVEMFFIISGILFTVAYLDKIGVIIFPLILLLKNAFLDCFLSRVLQLLYYILRIIIYLKNMKS